MALGAKDYLRLMNPSVGPPIAKIPLSTPHDLDDVIDIAGKVSIEFFTKLKKTTEWDPESKVNWLS